jgi:hypothetical protein
MFEPVLIDERRPLEIRCPHGTTSWNPCVDCAAVVPLLSDGPRMPRTLRALDAALRAFGVCRAIWRRLW